LNDMPTNMHHESSCQLRDSDMTVNLSTSLFTLIFALTVAL
jgi:hypothetical protein